ncbi:MAG TPA: SDR family oxidoreductase [Terriglobia bacterium]|nr:SDR family oxidoreductase [Terriglobia bacterium]
MNVFLTGVTGFLGGELAVFLSKSPRIGRIYCLVREYDGVDPTARLREVFDFHGDAFDKRRVIPVFGDLKDDQLAEKLIQDKRFQEVDTVIHSAADTSFAPGSSRNVFKVNVRGTNQILRWAKTLPKLETFVYVGTASICGADLRGNHLYEDQSPRKEAKHLVRYSYTKMLGEMHVTRAIPKEKLLIVRPSIIMGDSRDRRPRSYVILWALAALNAIRLIPTNPQSNLDVIPIDYAAQAIAALLFAKRRWTTYHISAGKASATNLEKMLASIAGSPNGHPPAKFVAPELLKQMKKWPKRLRSASELLEYPQYLDYWHTTFNGTLRIIMAGLEPYFQFIELDQTFDNTRLMADTGLDAPPPPHEYLLRTGKYLSEINLKEGALDP